MAFTATQSFLVRFARRAGVAVMAIAGLAVAGWIFDVRTLQSVWPAFVAMNPVTALLLAFAAVSLRILSAEKPGGKKMRWIGFAFGGIVTAIALAKLSSLIFGAEAFAVDQWLFPGQLDTGARFPTNEMAPNTALTFLLIGSGLVLFDWHTKEKVHPAHGLFLFAGFIALLALVGYAYRVLPLYRVGSAIPMALNTAIALELLSLGALAARPDRGMMKAISSDTTGGAMARRLLPAALLLPFALGGLRLLGENRGLFGTEFGVSLFAVATMLAFTCLIWWNARLLYRAERERNRAEQRLAIQYGVNRVLAESLSVHDAIQRILESVCTTMKWPGGAMWHVDERGGVAHCAETWQLNEPGLAAFGDACKRATIGRDAGLPGAAWEAGRPVWLEDVTREGALLRTPLALGAGLRSAFAFPVRCDDMTCGVMEFFSRDTRAPDEALMETFAVAGSQIGQFLERKHAEERLRQATKELERSNAELQQFAYIASHDLNEPLRMVRSYLDLLLDKFGGRLDAEAREFVNHALDGAKRMQGLIADLLAYARVGSRGNALQPTNCDAVLDAALANLKVAIAESGTKIKNDRLPTVMADEVQLTQVFQNLLGNALKFRGTAPPVIQIGAARQDGEWVVHVRDNGIGISSRSFERIFVLFQRLHTRAEYPGTGMGLAICKKIIECHGGRIWVESKEGEGTTFFFTLPALKHGTAGITQG